MLTPAQIGKVRPKVGGKNVVAKTNGVLAAKAKSNAANRSVAVRWTGKATNNVAGNPRQGAAYKVGVRPDGTRVHRYPAQAGGLPAETVVLKRKRSTPTTPKG